MRFDLLVAIPTVAIIAAAPAAPSPTDGILQTSALGILAAIIYWQQKCTDRRFDKLLSAVLQCPQCKAMDSTQDRQREITDD